MLDHLSAEFAALPRDKTCWVALSGGLDSLTLLAAVVEFSRSHAAPPVAAIHVHHGLADAAGDWAAHCREYCALWAVPLTVAEVVVSDASSMGLEAAARQARYAAFSAVLGPGEVLLQAHHQDDQVETVLFRLLRGAGPQGLAGIPRRRALGRGELRRPLLDTPRAAIAAWAEKRGLVPVNDPGNEDLRFDRNFLRHRVMPILAERWPGYRDTVTRSAAHQRDLIDHRLDGVEFASWPATGEQVIEVMRNETEASLKDRLYLWLTAMGVSPPDHRQLKEFARQSLVAATDKSPALDWHALRLSRWKGNIFLVHPAPPAMWPVSLPVGEGRVFPWGTLQWRSAESEGLPAGLPLTLRTRRPGERVEPLGRPARSISQWWQECGVPPWWRDRLPLLCSSDDEVLAVLGAGLTEQGQRRAVTAPGLALLAPAFAPLVANVN